LGKKIFGWWINCFKKSEDAFIEECELIRSDMLENDLDIQGQFASEQQMRDEFGWTETLVFTTWSKTTWSKHQAFSNFFIAGKQSK